MTARQNYGLLAVSTRDHELALEACVTGCPWHLMGFYFYYQDTMRFLLCTPLYRPLPQWLADTLTLADLLSHPMVTHHTIRALVIPPAKAERYRRFFDLTLVEKMKYFTQSHPEYFWETVFTDEGTYPNTALAHEICNFTNDIITFARREDVGYELLEDFSIDDLFTKSMDLLSDPMSFDDKSFNRTRRAMLSSTEIMSKFERYSPKTRPSEDALGMVTKLVYTLKDRCATDPATLDLAIATITKGRQEAYRRTVEEESEIARGVLTLAFDKLMEAFGDVPRTGNLDPIELSARINTLGRVVEKVSLDKSDGRIKRLTSKWPSSINVVGVGQGKHDNLVESIHGLTRLLNGVEESRQNGKIPTININFLIKLNNALAHAYGTGSRKDYLVPSSSGSRAHHIHAKYELDPIPTPWYLASGKLVELGDEPSLLTYDLSELQELLGYLRDKEPILPHFYGYHRCVEDRIAGILAEA